MDETAEMELELLTTDASCVDEELSQLLALADEDDSWADWLTERVGAGGVEPLTPANHTGSDSVYSSSHDADVTTDSDESPLDRRRRRNRELMAQARTDQRDSVAKLTKQEAALHHILRQLLTHKKPVLVPGEPRTVLQSYQARVTELVRAREALVMEKRQLLEALRDRSQRMLAIEMMTAYQFSPGERLSDDERLGQSHTEKLSALSITPRYEVLQTPTKQAATRPASVFTAVEREDVAKPGCWIQFLEHEPPIFYEHLEADACAALVSQSLQVIDGIHQVLDVPQGVLYAAQCLGWKLERTREVNASSARPQLRMRCAKRIPRARASIEELQNRTWTFLDHPENLEQANNGSISAKLAQRLDDNNFVLLRNSPDKTNHKLFRYFSLNSRLQSTGADRSAIVLMVVLGKQAHPREPSSPAIKWMDQGCSCLRFRDAGDDAIQLEYTATIECVSEEHASSVVVANCVALLKWEHFVAPPRLLAE